MPTIRVLITGSRNWPCVDLAESVVARLLARYGPGLLVVHGDCPTGVDHSFSEACATLGVDQERHPADWSLGRRAGPLRNQSMVDAGALFAIALSKDLSSSRGTADCVRRCLVAGIAVWLVSDEDGVARRLVEMGPA